jgi:Spy/CpxP family protein refolding chaperone
MIRFTRNILLSLSLLGLFAAMAGAGPTATGHEGHQHEAEPAPALSSPQPETGTPMMPGMMETMRNKMMMERMGRGGDMMPPDAGMEPPSPAVKLQMMNRALAGPMNMDPDMMRTMMDREFFLDRIDELGLSDDQVAKLRAIRSACRQDNIRTGAEAKIVRLELDDLLALDDWTPAAAEKLIRQQQKLEGDMQVRHLQAVAEARKVLTKEQLRRIHDDRVYPAMESPVH